MNFNEAREHKIKIDRIKKIHKIQTELESVINGTPTGVARNYLTDANIHIMAAVEHLERM